MRFSDILHYVQINRAKAKRNERIVQLAKNQLRKTLDGLPYPDALYFTSHVVNYLDSYLDGRSSVEVYRSVASWELDERRKPCCIRATLDPVVFNGIDRASQTANLVILIERVANALMPKGKALRATLGKGDMIVLAGMEGVDSRAMKRCMDAMKSRQHALLKEREKLH